MTSDISLTLDDMRLFFIKNGGKVTNHTLVNHFKTFLMNPETKDESRSKFKQIVNQISTVKHENDVKYLILKKKYLGNLEYNNEIHKRTDQINSPKEINFRQQTSNGAEISLQQQIPAALSNNNTKVIQRYNSSTENQCVEKRNFDCINEVTKNNNVFKNMAVSNEIVTNDKVSNNNNDNKIKALKSSLEPACFTTNSDKKDFSQNCTEQRTDLRSKPVLIMKNDDCAETETDLNLSVKEKMQKFSKMVENTDRINNANVEKKSSVKIDQKYKELWLIKAAQCNYQELFKLANENPYLSSIKDPATGYTALHWAAKAGNQNIAKLVAGTFKANVNARSNGGYTPLHIAAQYGKDDIIDLLVKVYGADPNIRDYAGKKPHQYQQSLESHALSEDTYHKIKTSRKKLLAERDAGFLRMGSFMRVRRTTEAVMTHFLGSNTFKPSSPLPIIDYERDDVFGNTDHFVLNGKISPETGPTIVRSWSSTGDVTQDTVMQVQPK